MKIQLHDVIKNAQCWDDVYQELSKYNAKASPHSKKKSVAGKLFEEFCEYYYKAEPSEIHSYKSVNLFKDTHSKIIERLKLGKVEHGIDLILESHEGELSAVQCKFTNDQNSNVSWSRNKIANLFAEGDLGDYFVVFTNAANIDRHSLTKKPGKLKVITFNTLSQLSSETLENIKRLAEKKKPIPHKPYEPRDHQKQAIQAVINGFEKSDRGQLILPCGAGKTLTALWIKDALDAKRTIVLLPSLALLRQIKKEWQENQTHHIASICVCSESDISNEEDCIQDNLYEISGKVSTNPDEIRTWLSHHEECIVFSTYQSLEAVCDAVRSTSVVFDLAICDEAHKTTGGKNNQFTLIHSNDNLPVKTRLYMTATPRVVTGGLKNVKNDDIRYLYDMSNPKYFGPEFYYMSFKQAIDSNILVDYQIIAIGIGDQELAEAIKQRKYVTNYSTLDEVANNFALEKMMQMHGPTHALTFHSSVSKAGAFKKRHCEIFPLIKTDHVNGNMTTNEREKRLREFKAEEKAVMTNARCLTEGVDVPAIDVVYFCDPKNSKIDIVQAAGRALRKADNKKIGYIVVPIFHTERGSLDEVIQSGPFKNLINVIRSLSAHDDRLVAEINNIKSQLGKQKTNTQHFFIESTEKVITIIGFEQALQEALFDQIVNKIKVPWRNFVEANEFARSLRLKNVDAWKAYCNTGEKPIDIPEYPQDIYKTCGWSTWGDWLGTGVVANQNRNYRTFYDARDFARSLNLEGLQAWQSYSKGGSRPADIHSLPSRYYKDKGWISWGDWLGNGNVANCNKKFKPFEEAREFARSLHLENGKAWKIYYTTHSIPIDIPEYPDDIYKNKGWISWGDWLGNGNVANFNKKFRPFEEAREFARSLRLENRNAWEAYSKSGNLPADIPASPRGFYIDQGWISWGDWLGNSNVANSNKKFRPFEKAREFARSLYLENRNAWEAYSKSGNLPADIPASPRGFYIDQGWISWGDWLGKFS
ncbi:MAG: DEAD/DEAH box helicase family protein [Pseudomonadota bacterium]